MPMFRIIPCLLGCWFVIAVSCTTESAPSVMNQETIIEDDTLLLGAVNRAGLQLPNYQYWFESTYQAYQPKQDILGQLRPAMEGTEIKVFMGTWCEDSQRDVPALYRILDDLDYDISGLQLIGVDRTKKLPEAELAGHFIEFVPTLVLFREGKEVGRIVEMPNLTLEEDLLEILSL
jgi:thiol-disulfide isomerase/thioredoxin